MASRAAGGSAVRTTIFARRGRGARDRPLPLFARRPETARAQARRLARAYRAGGRDASLVNGGARGARDERDLLTQRVEVSGAGVSLLFLGYGNDSRESARC